MISGQLVSFADLDVILKKAELGTEYIYYIATEEEKKYRFGVIRLDDRSYRRAVELYDSGFRYLNDRYDKSTDFIVIHCPFNLYADEPLTMRGWNRSAFFSNYFLALGFYLRCKEAGRWLER